jgi:general secretion pathway protein L
MKTGLVLQLPGAALDAGSEVAWYLFAGGALQRSGSAPLSDLRAQLPAQITGETLVLVPGELVLLTSVRIPARQLRQIKQALPYMVEELIADNIEDVHLALPPLTGAKLGEAIPVAVVRHALLINWLDQLYQHGIQPDRLCPDTLALPWRSNGRSFFFTGERLLYRDGLSSGLALSRAQLPDLLPLLAAAAPPAIVTVGAGSEVAAQLPLLVAEIEQAFGGQVESRSYSEQGGEVLAASAARQADEMINLLQGGYRIRRDQDRDRDWRRAAVVAGVGLLLYAALAGGSAVWFSWQAARLEERSFALYRELFPQERRVISPRRQMMAHLNQGGGGGSMLPLLARAADQLATVQLQELRFRRDSQRLQLQLQAADLAALDQLKQRLVGSGLDVAIDSAAEQGGVTIGRVTIGGGR